MKFGDVQKEYKFTFKAQVGLEVSTGMPLDRCVANATSRIVVGHAVHQMLNACEPLTVDEAFELLEEQNASGGLDDITAIVMSELVIATGNSQADAKKAEKMYRLARQKDRRNFTKALSDQLKGLDATEEGKEPPGPGETSKSSV